MIEKNFFSEAEGWEFAEYIKIIKAINLDSEKSVQFMKKNAFITFLRANTLLEQLEFILEKTIGI